MDDKRGPICVDLDGTLVRTDILHETFLRWVLRNPLNLLPALHWILKGKAYFKRQCALRTPADYSLFPVNSQFFDFLRKEAASGRKLLLVTASDQIHADKFAELYPLFDAAIGSDGEVNLSGVRKRDRLVKEFGHKNFDYAGNSSEDLAIFPAAANSYLVEATPKLIKEARKLGNLQAAFSVKSVSIRNILKTFRISQWLKNVLVFSPLIMAHKIYDTELLWRSLVTFLAFGLIASGVYILNDIMDLDSDRSHPSKRHRPIASGDFPIIWGTALFPILTFFGLALAFHVSVETGLVLMTYLALTTGYSFFLKKQLLVDVIVLSSLYTLRIIAGSVSTAVPISPWMLAFSVFMFFSLALMKRCTELQNVIRSGAEGVVGRGYLAIDFQTLSNAGIASGYMSIMVLALFINSENVRILYKNPSILWLLCPVLLYWITRVWVMVGRGHMYEDPIVFSFSDKTSHLLMVLSIMLLIAASGI